jgi:CBS domain-containing protein
MAVLGELMSRNLLTVAPEDTLGEAAERMTEGGVGSAVVLDSGRLIGILTERDVLRAAAGRVHSSDARVREWMTPDPIVAAEETTAAESLETMMAHGFRHLPIVDGERVVGIVSIRDVMAASLRAATGARSSGL